MATDPVEEIQSVSDTALRDEETVKEYVTRVGEDHDLDTQLVQGALLYVTEYYYSEGTPDDRSALDAFLDSVNSAGGVSAAGGPPDSEDSTGAGESTEYNSTVGTEADKSTESEDSTGAGELPETDDSIGADRSPEPDDLIEAGAGESTEREDPTGVSDPPETEDSIETRPPAEAEDQTSEDPPENKERSEVEQSRRPPASTGTDTVKSGSPVTEPLNTDEVQPGFKTGIRGKKPLKLVLRFLVIVVTTPVIGWMLSRAWVPGNSIYDQGREFLTELLGVPGPEATKLFVLFAFGVYLGLLVLLTVDLRKRVQAMLLWLGTALALGVVASVGWVIPRVELTQLNVLGFLLGLVTAIVLEADQLRAIDSSASSFRRPTQSSGAVAEFRYAAGVLFVVLLVAVVATLAQLVLADATQVSDPIAAVVFLVVAFQFVSYESETSYATLGPERSGKSMLMLGLCLTLLQNNEMHPDPNSYLQSSLERASNLKPGQTTWPIPSTEPDALRAASFEVIAGYYFPRRLELTALDYAGQHLTRSAERIGTGTSEADDDGVPARVVDWIEQADTLLFILDVERLVYPEEFSDGAVGDETISWGLEHYTTTTEGVDPDDTIVVATKCDILIDTGKVDPPQSYNSYDEFRAAVTEYLTARPDVQELLATTGESTIHPVYFVTERRDGTYVPYLDDNGNLTPVGYGQLVDEMRARQ